MTRARTLSVLFVFALAAVGAVFAARVAVSEIERRSVIEVQAALAGDDLGFADARSDGLRLVLAGTAPDEAARFRALAVAGELVDAARIEDRMDVAQAEPVAPPEFSLEILRNGADVTAMGLVPATAGKDALMAAIGRTGGGTLTDLVETVGAPEPADWGAALDFALRVLGRLERAQISVTPGHVVARSMAPSRAARDRMLGDLRRIAPDDVDVSLDITAPRPALTPFLLRAVKTAEGGVRLDACAAAEDADRAAILRAAAEAGAADAECQLALGAPDAEWPRAASAGLAALGALPAGGTLVLSDYDVTLTGRPGSGASTFEEVAARLEAGLPQGFSLAARVPDETAPEGEARPAEVTVSRNPEGRVQLRGAVADARARDAVNSLARAVFGRDTVASALQIKEAVPAAWTPRVLAGIDALSVLRSGTAIIEEKRLALRGVTGSQDASNEIAQLLTARLGEDAIFEIDVRYDKRLDPVLALPSPQECVDQANGILAARKITFAPGSDTIDSGASDTLDAVADLLRKCEDIPIEVAGFTDSQGGEEMNRRLSEDRARAVLVALADRRVITRDITAAGYGEERPVADNATEAGREANRRIEFALLDPDAEETAASDADAAAALDEDDDAAPDADDGAAPDADTAADAADEAGE